MNGRYRTVSTFGAALLAGAVLAIVAAQGRTSGRGALASGASPIRMGQGSKGADGTAPSIGLGEGSKAAPTHSLRSVQATRTPSMRMGAGGAFVGVVRPFVARYCVGCHSSKLKTGRLDLERFAGLPELRRDLKPWQGVIDHLEVGDMPPRGSLQPSGAEKRKITGLVRNFLAELARAEAGDPGYVPLRRLSNTEYDCTVRDLTGVDLRPAREFPADGAAGEGFTNAAEALTDISPALFTKYMAAAKEIAEHAVLLPDGMRFARGKTRRDWTDAATARIRSFYSRWTGPEGRLDFKPYLLATVRHREELRSAKVTAAEVAKREGLNAKYLGILWKALNDTTRSEPLDAVREVWRRATEKDVDGLAAQVMVLQGALWQSVRVGSYIRPVGKGYAVSLSRQVAADPEAVESQELRFSAKGAALGNEVTLRLVSRELLPLVAERKPGASTLTPSPSPSEGRGGKSAPPEVEWRNARFEAVGRPTLMLKDYARYGRSFEVDYRAPFEKTATYLGAAIEAANAKQGLQVAAVEEISKRRGLDPELLRRWIAVLGVESYDKSAATAFPGRPVAVAPIELLSEPMRGEGARKAINGWRIKGSDLPAVFANSSDTLEHIPGDASPHSVMVHPTPTEFVAVAWTSPVAGVVRVSASIQHAHPACGNGVAWWLEQRRLDRASMFAEGLVALGGSALTGEKLVSVEKGDVLMLAVDAKNGDHGCDLTRVGLTIIERGGENRVWDLSQDVAGNVLDGNPHADGLGNAGVWSFVKGPTRPVGASASRLIPEGSLLAEWRSIASDPVRKAIADEIAERAQKMLTGPQPPLDTPDGKVYTMLLSPDGPLFQGIDPSRLPPLRQTQPFGLPADRFGMFDGSITADENSSVEIRLPAALLAGRDFVVDAALKAPAAGRAAVFQITTQRVRDGLSLIWDRKSSVVTDPKGPAYRRIIAGNDRFRELFPLFLCFPNVIPNDEVVSLKMFHREDEALKRLFLSEADSRQIDRLWDEHRFISRQPVAENKYLPLFIGFVTQDQPKEMVTFFEGQKPTFQLRADAFEKDEAAAIPRQLNALADFTARGFRRSLSAKELADQRALYRSLRAKGMAHDEALRSIVARVLVSPLFLFRIEQAPAGRIAGLVSDWELATRLSYFLWSAAPDEELRKLAEAGKLRNPETLVTETRRMLLDPRVRSLAVEFGAQWLQVRGFDALSEKNERLFPMFDEHLRRAIYEETVLFFQDLFQRDRPIVNLLDADYTYLNDSLAKHYGVTGVSGPEWRLVEHVRQYGRGGVLGLATVLTKESGASRTSPVLRGNWVSETLLGERLPRPPPTVPKLPEEEGSRGLTIRQQVEMHSKAPECATCHRRIDGFGFALERYDPIGRWRDKDLAGLPVDAHAKVLDGSQFEGIDGLRSYLLTRKREVVVRLFLRRLLGYALGRSVANSDQPLLDAMMASWRKNGRVGAAVEAIVRSPQFRMIRGREYERIFRSL